MAAPSKKKHRESTDLGHDPNRESWNGLAVKRTGKIDLETCWRLLKTALEVADEQRASPRMLAIMRTATADRGGYRIWHPDEPTPGPALMAVANLILSNCRPCEVRRAPAGTTGTIWVVGRLPVASATLTAAASFAWSDSRAARTAELEAYLAERNRPRLLAKVSRESREPVGG